MMSHPQASLGFRIRVGAILACTVLLASGCGPDYKNRGVVRGKVMLGSRPLPSGTVMFYGKDGMTATAPIESDGTYVMMDAPVGECQVTVTVPSLPQDASVRARMQGKGPKLPDGPKPPEGAAGVSPPLPSNPKVPKEIVPIDAKYGSPETSGLKFTVKKGEQTYDIEL